MRTLNQEDGFSYIDVIIAITILSVGILGATSAITYGLIRSYDSERQVQAKDRANSVMESVFTARDQEVPTSIAGWQQVGIIGTNPAPGADGENPVLGATGAPMGIFVADWSPVREDPGLDGLFGTIDDACAPRVACPNSDRSTNTSREIPGFQQKIEITDLEVTNRPSETWGILQRRVDVTVRYPVNQTFREEKISTVIALFK